MARQYLAGELPAQEHARRRIPGHGACGIVSAERLWHLRHGGKRVGMVCRLVSAGLLRAQSGKKSARPGNEFRSQRARRHETRATRWFVSLQRGLVNRLPPELSHEEFARHRDAAHGVSRCERWAGTCLTLTARQRSNTDFSQFLLVVEQKQGDRLVGLQRKRADAEMIRSVLSLLGDGWLDGEQHAPR